VTLFRFPGPDDSMSRAFDAQAGRVVTLSPKLEIARRQVAEERLDVLYYPEIGMDPLAYFLAFARLAPVQCVSWGHPVTSGIPTIDYFLSSARMEPEGAEAHYTETLVRFPNINVYYEEPKLTLPAKVRQDFGLDEAAHLYLCTQSLFKIHPDFDEVLGAILSADAQAIVVLLTGVHPSWEKALQARFRRTLPEQAHRIRFLPRQSQDDFLHVQALADVLLDTFPFGGGNTGYEALAFGTPIVTMPGAFLRGRLTYAFYEQMGVLDCVARSPQEYANIAVRLGTDPAHRATVRDRILASKDRLYEDRTVIRDLEEFLAASVRRAWSPVTR
jgi:predicted O-linked N-acetylglucosamine transferase (SPINDLY family)